MERLHTIIQAGRRKACWDLLIAGLTLAVALVMPYRLVQGSFRFDFLYWLITAVFILDVPVSFAVSATDRHGRSVARGAVARSYASSWLMPDVLAALPLAAVAWFLSSGAISGAAGFTVLGLLPLLKLLKVMSTFQGHKHLVNLPPALMRLAVFLFWFVLLTHGMSLGWIVIGAVEPQRVFADRYIRALYWCVTTITTIGYGDYGPDHDSNRQILYTIAVQLTGVGMFSYIIGNMATLIVNLDTARAEFRARVEDVCNTLRIQRIPATLQSRVKQYYDYLWETRKGLSNDRFLQDLPRTLRLEVSLHLNRDILEKVALFKDADEGFIRAVVEELEALVFLPGDWIIRQGEFGSCMYFLSRGEVEILVDGAPVARLPEGSAFGETALLQGERRNASVRALEYCDAYRLSKASFDGLREAHPEFDGKVREIMNRRLKSTDVPASREC